MQQQEQTTCFANFDARQQRARCLGARCQASSEQQKPPRFVKNANVLFPRDYSDLVEQVGTYSNFHPPMAVMFLSFEFSEHRESLSLTVLSPGNASLHLLMV
jgi:hypothetical protein